MDNYQKTRNWQDVTLRELYTHWDMGIEELPNPLTFDIARYMNAYVLGDIHGDGIDVRADYADEAAAIYHSKVKRDELKEEFEKNGWEETDYDGWKTYFIKGNTEVALHYDAASDEVGYMDVNFITDFPDDAYNIEYFYDHVEPKEEKNAMELLKEAFHYIDDERRVAERVLEGTDGFTDTDCDYIIKGCNLLEEAMKLLETEK